MPSSEPPFQVLPGTHAGPVQSVDRALQVLEALGTLGVAGAGDIAPHLGVHKSTVSRLLASLEARGFVEPTDTWGKYRLGFALTRLAGQAFAQIDLARMGQAPCDEVAEQVGETTNIAVLDGPRVVNITEGRSVAEVALRSWTGQSSPAHATASGKALLLAHDRRALAGQVGRKLEGFTDRSITDLRTLEDTLDEARARGWTSVEEELEIGLNAVAAPIYDHAGALVAAMSASGPAYRLGPERFSDVASVVVDAADAISLRLGGKRPQDD
ncbi:IclR family transcriptional regulator [Demetria terragena]|uniref:IclR family transcriptional regulator n=1 Tax=Demetria terragena TaxID=63959 RepID=UPI00037E848D|nr:IclR family transcriptional regulator C-terminal domain-containing protein [Demetria terragena]